MLTAACLQAAACGCRPAGACCAAPNPAATIGLQERLASWPMLPLELRRAVGDRYGFVVRLPGEAEEEALRNGAGPGEQRKLTREDAARVSAGGRRTRCAHMCGCLGRCRQCMLCSHSQAWVVCVVGHVARIA